MNSAPTETPAPDYGEPWRKQATHDDDFGCCLSIESGNSTVARLLNACEASETDFDRIIACVNSMAGVANPAAFVAEAKEMQKALEIAKHALDQIASLQDEKGNRLYESGCADIAHTAFFKLQPFLP